MSRHLDDALAAIDRALGTQEQWRPVNRSQAEWWCGTCEITIGVELHKSTPPCPDCGGDLVRWNWSKDPTKGEGHWQYPP